jgi:orotidine-5'-phosphate decarboxylase
MRHWYLRVFFALLAMAVTVPRLSDLGQYITVIKMHTDVVKDFNVETIQGLQLLTKKHNFMIFEDRKLIDIGQQQYHEGALGISEWVGIVNLSMLGGDGIVDALTQTITGPDFQFRNERALLIVAKMTSRGSLATASYIERCIDLARKSPESVTSFVAT